MVAISEGLTTQVIDPLHANPHMIKGNPELTGSCESLECIHGGNDLKGLNVRAFTYTVILRRGASRTCENGSCEENWLGTIKP